MPASIECRFRKFALSRGNRHWGRASNPTLLSHVEVRLGHIHISPCGPVGLSTRAADIGVGLQADSSRRE